MQQSYLLSRYQHHSSALAHMQSAVSVALFLLLFAHDSALPVLQDKSPIRLQHEEAMKTSEQYPLTVEPWCSTLS